MSNKEKKARKSDLAARYTGELAEPIVLRTVGLLEIPDPDQNISQLRSAKLPALFEWFSIDRNDPTCWTQLALWLALKHVNGMQVRSVPRPQRLSSEIAEELLIETNRLMKERNISRSGALAILRRRARFNDYTVGSLDNMYRSAERQYRLLHDEAVQRLSLDRPMPTE